MNRAIVQRAHSSDIAAIEELLTASDLPTDGVRDHIQNFFIIQDGGELLGCVGLEAYGADGLFRSLAVRSSARSRGLGDLLFRSAIAEAEHIGIRRLLLLTTTAEAYFSARGFRPIARDTIQGDVWNSAEFRGACPASAVCMEFCFPGARDHTNETAAR